MRPLYEFNDAWVAAATYGDSDADLYALFDEAFEEVEAEIRDELLRRGRSDDFEVGRDDEGIYIGLTEEQAYDEFGGPDHPIKPAVRPALVSASPRAKLRAERVFDV